MSARHPLTLDLNKVTCIGMLVEKVQSQDLVVERPPGRNHPQEYILDLYLPDNRAMHDPDSRAMHDTGWARRQGSWQSQHLCLTAPLT